MKIKTTMSEIPFEEMDSEQQKVFADINNAIRLVYQNLDPSKWKSMSFDSVFDSGFQNLKEQFAQMAEAGTLDESVINSYSNLKAELSDVDLSSKDVVDQFYAMARSSKEAGQGAESIVEAVKSAESAYADGTKSVETFSSANKDLSSVLKDIYNGEKLSSDTLLELITQYPKYASLIASVNDSKENAVKLAEILFEANKQQAMSELENDKKVLESTEKKIDAERDLLSVKRQEYALDHLWSVVADTDVQLVSLDEQKRAIQQKAQAIQESMNLIGGMTWQSIGSEGAGGKDPWVEAYEKNAKELKYALDLRQITLKDYAVLWARMN